MPGDRNISDLGILAGLTIITTNLDLFGFFFLLTSKNPVFFFTSGSRWFLRSGLEEWGMQHTSVLCSVD